MKKNNGIYILISTIIFCIFGYYTVNNILFHLEKNGNVTKIVVDDTGISAAVDKVYDSVVAINVYRDDDFIGVGSGFVFSKDGYIITNYHVIEKNSGYSVIYGDETITAEFIGSDEYADIAVLKIDPSYVKKVALIGDSNVSKVGDTIFTVGSPVSSEYIGTVTKGIISNKNRKVEVSVKSETLDWILDVIQIDAPINGGNSGGPLCNVNGEVIGINTMKISNSDVEGISFAIPIEIALDYANKIINKEEIERPMLGIRMSNVYNSSHLSYYDIKLDKSINSGVVVIEPIVDGPGYNYGLMKGDVITKLNDVNIGNIAELNYNLFKYKSGDKLNLELIRNKENINLEVVLGKREN